MMFAVFIITDVRNALEKGCTASFPLFSQPVTMMLFQDAVYASACIESTLSYTGDYMYQPLTARVRDHIILYRGVLMAMKSPGGGNGF